MSNPVPAFPATVFPPEGQRLAVVIHMPVSKDRMVVGTYRRNALYDDNSRLMIGSWGAAATSGLVGRWAPVGPLVGNLRHG